MIYIAGFVLLTLTATALKIYQASIIAYIIIAFVLYMALGYLSKPLLLTIINKAQRHNTDIIVEFSHANYPQLVNKPVRLFITTIPLYAHLSLSAVFFSGKWYVLGALYAIAAICYILCGYIGNAEPLMSWYVPSYIILCGINIILFSIAFITRWVNIYCTITLLYSILLLPYLLTSRQIRATFPFGDVKNYMLRRGIKPIKGDII